MGPAAVAGSCAELAQENRERPRGSRPRGRSLHFSAVQPSGPDIPTRRGGGGVYQVPEVRAREVGVVHGGAEVRVPQHLLDLYHVLALRQPGGGAAVAEAVLVQVLRQTGPLRRALERPPERADPGTRLGVAPRARVVEHPLRAVSIVGGEPEAGEVLPHRRHEAGRHGTHRPFRSWCAGRCTRSPPTGTRRRNARPTTPSTEPRSRTAPPSRRG